MATQKVIRKRITSVKNTQKITKAMKMVSAAKLRRAQTRLADARPYFQGMESLLRYAATLAGDHPLFEGREPVKKASFLILTSDRGLCGGFNGNLLRKIDNYLRDEKFPYQEVQVHMIGKKGRDFFKARGRELTSIEIGLYDKFQFENAVKIANDLMSGYAENKFDHFFLVYNRFKSAIDQEAQIQKILPIEPAPIEEYLPEYLYEPSKGEILETLVPRGLAALIYRAFLESIAAEFGARMTAMESATSNCTDMIQKLTLKLNRVRQAAITKELMDIVNGAEALK